MGFLWLWWAGATLHCGAWASHCRVFSHCGAQALGIWPSVGSWGTWDLFAPWNVESPQMGLNLCLLHWQADSCPLYHQASPPILIWKRKVSSFSRGVVGSCPGKTRCYGDFPKPLGEKELFEMESVAKKKCSRIFGLEILIIFEIQLPFIFFYFWIFLSFSLLANARSLNISFKNIRWLFFFFCNPGANDSHMLWSK